MKTSTFAWTLTALIVLAGIAWYVYANTSSAYTAPAATTADTTVNTGPGPDYTGGDMAPTPSTPIASSTVTSSTSLQVR